MAEDPRKPGDGPAGEAAPAEGNDPFELPIDGVLDLHTFSPRDVKDLVPEYIGECLRRGLTEIRIIHGKGTGALKATVQALLKKDPRVAGFTDAGLDAGGWGATIVKLADPNAPDP
jgi:dsDNA-specific endonuclease/ATPase MutS2